MKHYYYGLFIKVEGSWIRVDKTSGFTLDTAKEQFRPLVLTLMDAGLDPVLRPLPRVKQIRVDNADRRYAPTPW